MVFLAKGNGATDSKTKKPAVCNWKGLVSQPIGEWRYTVSGYFSKLDDSLLAKAQNRWSMGAFGCSHWFIIGNLLCSEKLSIKSNCC